MMLSKESSQAIFEMGNVIQNSMPIMSTMRFQRTIHLHVASFWDPTRRWYDVWKQILELSKHPSSVRLSWPQEVTNMDPTCGRNITTRQKTHYEVREWTRERIRRSGLDGKMTRPTGSPNSPLVGHMLGYVRCLGKMPRPHRTDWYLSYNVAWTTRQISQSDLSTKCWWRLATTFINKARVPRSKDYMSRDAKAIATRFGNPIHPKEWTEALTWSTRSFTARVPWVAKHKLGRALRKRTRTPNLIFLFSVVFNIWWSTQSWSSNWKGWHQHSWQDDKCQTNGDRQHQLVFKNEVDSSLRKLGTWLQKDQSEVAIDKNQQTWPPSWLNFLVAFSRPVSGNSLNATGSVHNHLTGRVSFAHVQCGHTTSAQGKMSCASFTVFHIYLVS